MNDYQTWAARHPHAAAELQAILTDCTATRPPSPEAVGKPEAWAQQQARFRAAEGGALSWRNNVGATPAKTRHTCPHCSRPFEEKQQPIRYGLANDSAQLNKRIKSSDLILAIPRLIGPADVGKTIAQFGAVETKRPGWRYTGKGTEPGQAAWLALIQKAGGFACFSTGELTL